MGMKPMSKLNFELRPTSGTCLCELINSGMCDGAKEQVICPSHPSNRSIPHHGAVYMFFWKVFGWYIGHEFFGRIARAIKTKAHKWHWVHTWGMWVNGRTFPVAYPWTKAGCFAHYVTNQVRHCEQCGLMEKNTLWT
jgi:hypothetical protein